MRRTFNSMFPGHANRPNVQIGDHLCEPETQSRVASGIAEQFVRGKYTDTTLGDRRQICFGNSTAQTFHDAENGFAVLWSMDRYALAVLEN